MPVGFCSATVNLFSVGRIGDENFQIRIPETESVLSVNDVWKWLFGTVGASLRQLALVKINLFVRTLVFTTDLQVLQSSPRDKSPYCSGCQQHLISVLGRLSAFYPLCTSADALCSLCPQTLSHSLRMADQNFEKLKDESDRLEQHAKKSVNWLLWIMLIVVCFIFISMILFIRIFPKLKWFFLTATSQKAQLVW